MKIGCSDFMNFKVSLKYIVQLINMELVKVATCTGPKFEHVATCTSQPVQVATCTDFLYKLQLVQNLNLYITDTLLQIW